MAQPPGGNLELERAIVGALRDQIRAHGPITAEWIGSAAKRVLGQLGNAKATGLARALGARRMRQMTEAERHEMSAAGGRTAAERMTPEERVERARKAGSSYWANLSPEERSAEMRRRRAKQKA